MARPLKTGLSFYYKDAHEWSDYRIIDLVETYGPIGYAIFDVIRGEVYQNGYYLEISPEKIALLVTHVIGSRWIENRATVIQVMAYCAEIGLLDADMLAQSVITSVDMQMHYAQVAARRKNDKSKYWLLKEEETEDGDPSDNPVDLSDIKSAETGINAAETRIYTAEMQQRKENKRKENKSKANKSKANKSKAALRDAAAAACCRTGKEEYDGIYGDPEAEYEYGEGYGYHRESEYEYPGNDYGDGCEEEYG